MTEWLSKFFLSKVTVTNAAAVLLCVVTMLFMWPWISHVTAERSIPEKYVFPLVGLAMLAFSYLCVCFIVFVAQKGRKLADKFQEYSRNEARRQNFEENVRVALPSLDKDILHLLYQIKNSEITVDLRKKSVVWLLREKWIYKVVKTSEIKCVVKLDPSVKKILNEYEQEELHKVIDQTIENMPEHHRVFLDIFWEDNIPFGTPESENLMPHKAYSAGHFLVQQGLLKISKSTSGVIDEEDFSLTDEAESALQEKIYQMPPKRKVVKISLKFVQASGASGGGAIGRSARRT